MITIDRRRNLVLTFLPTVTVRMLSAGLVHQPGYMDTACCAAGTIRIAAGQGFIEPFIWNYLNHPAGVPHPGFLYCMPGPSITTAVGGQTGSG